MRKKILIVSRGIPTTEEPLNGIFEWDQARALKQKEIDVCYAVIDLRSARKRRRWGITKTEKEGISVFSIAIPLGPVKKDVFNFIGRYAFRKLYHRIKNEFGVPDVIHAHFLDYGYMCNAVCAEESIPLVLTDHSSDYDCECDISRYAKGIYEQADAVIAVSTDMKERIQKWTGTISYVVYNVLDLNMPNGMADRGNSTFQYVSAGNLVPEKNYEILLKAFAKMPDKQCELTIYGDGKERISLEKLVEKLNLSERVHFIGRVPRKRLLKEYSQYDAFVLVSMRETFGVAYIEALALGLPVIATLNGGPKDFVNQENGILVDPKNKDNITAALCYMVSHYDEYDKKKFMQKIKLEFSAETIACNLIDVYSKLW